MAERARRRTNALPRGGNVTSLRGPRQWSVIPGGRPRGARRIGTSNFQPKIVPSEAHEVHHRLHRHLKVPVHIKLRTFLPTRRGFDVEYEVGSELKRRPLTTKEIKAINTFLVEYYKKKGTKFPVPMRRGKIDVGSALAAIATNNTAMDLLVKALHFT